MTMRRAPGSRFAIIGLAIMALVLSCALAPAAFAAEVDVWGAQDAFSESELAQDEIGVTTLNMSGEPGTAVYITVKDGDKVIAKNLPHTLGDTANSPSEDQSTVVDMFEIMVSGGEATLEPKLASGSYNVAVYASRAGGDALYEGTLYGVWARVGDSGETHLIGSRVVSGGSASAFTAPDMFYDSGSAYALASDEPVEEGNLLYYAYESYDASSAVDGVVKYVDPDGNVVATDMIAAIPYGGSKDFAVPQVVRADGKMYRTTYFLDSVTAANPGATSFIVPCVEMSASDQAASNFYRANIKMVDEDGTVIATDAVEVTGTFTYTVPSTIYKSITEEGVARSVAYELTADQDPVIVLDSATDHDKVVDGVREIVVTYQRQSATPSEVNVTFNLINGQERAKTGNSSRIIGTKQAIVSAENPVAQPDPTVDVDGREFVIAGSLEAYQYSYGSDREPVVNVYYVPADYVAPGPYEVTINYVNFASGETIASETATSDPDDIMGLSIAAPEQFSEGGVTYVRLDGQEEPIEHNYYSGVRSYTVYYRDINDVLTSGVVINRVRVVYRDVVETVTATAGAAAGVAGAAGTAGATGAAGVEGGAAGAAGAAGADQRLNADGTYNVADGAGNQSMTNQSGVNSTTERIEDTETALASGTEDSDAGVGGIPWLVIAGAAIAIIALVAAILSVLLKRRKDDSARRL